MANKYEEKIHNFVPPKWASKGPPGSFLSVLKDEELLEKFPLDDKEYYIFGRLYGDILILHESCSGVHAVLTFHKDLERWFLMDFESTHGTYIGTSRLEPDVFTPVDIDMGLKFACSTRKYFLRLYEMDPVPPKPKTPPSTSLENKTVKIEDIPKEKNEESKEIKLLNRKAKKKQYKYAKKKKDNPEPEYFDTNAMPGDFTGRFEYTGNTYILESAESFNNRQILLNMAKKKKKFDDRPQKKKKKGMGVTAESAVSKDPNSTVKLTFFKNIRF